MSKDKKATSPLDLTNVLGAIANAAKNPPKGFDPSAWWNGYHPGQATVDFDSIKLINFASAAIFNKSLNGGPPTIRAENLTKYEGKRDDDLLIDHFSSLGGRLVYIDPNKALTYYRHCLMFFVFADSAVQTLVRDWATELDNNHLVEIRSQIVTTDKNFSLKMKEFTKKVLENE
jgi:hypothetical protein